MLSFPLPPSRGKRLLVAAQSRVLGGAGSGNFGHAGRPGEVGGSSHTITVEGRKITIVKPKRARRDELVIIDVAKWDEDFSKTKSFYIGPGGSGNNAIGDRYKRFGEFIAKNDTIEAPEVSVHPDGRVDFTNGRHRYSWLRDHGVTHMPVAMERESLVYAKNYGYIQHLRVGGGEGSGDVPGHEFHGNQWTGSGTLEDPYRTKKAKSQAHPVGMKAQIVAGPHANKLGIVKAVAHHPGARTSRATLRKIESEAGEDLGFHHESNVKALEAFNFPLTPERGIRLLREAQRRVLGDFPGHPFHGNQWTGVVVGIIDSSGSVVTKKQMAPDQYHSELFPSKQNMHATQRFVLHNGDVRWNDEPSDDDYFTVDDYLASEGFKVDRHTVGDRYSPTGVKVIHPPKPKMLGGKSPLHSVADSHVAKLSVAFRYAFAVGRKAAKGRSTEKITAAMKSALESVLPKMLTKVAIDGGQVALDALEMKTLGGQGSGNFGHAGRPGEVGGSASNQWVGAGKDAIDKMPLIGGQIDVSKVLDKPISRNNRYAGEGETEKLPDKTEKLAIVDLYPTQAEGANKQTVYDYVNQPQESKAYEAIDVHERDGKKYISDGHHRVIAAILRGETHINADVTRIIKIRGLADGPLRLRFDGKNPSVIAWARKHAGELIDFILATTLERIRQASEDFQEDGDWDAYHDEILEAVGDEDRADLIARHESMLAANEGQRLGWKQAEEQGLLDSSAKRVWITTPDERLCPICKPLEDKTATLDGEYPGGYSGPPAHVQCRCTEGIQG